MSLSPGYGETPIDGDELDALLPAVREALGEPPTKAAVFDLEQQIQDEVAADSLTAVIDGSLALDELMTDHFVRDLHHRSYGDVWLWGGRLRVRELNLGVAPEYIAVELRTALENLTERWNATSDFTPRQLGIAVHAETVRIHPFADGNGRSTRLLADLVFAAAHDSTEVELYNWSIDKERYITLLREFDGHRNPADLAAFIGVRGLDA